MVVLVHSFQFYILDLSWRHYSLEEEEEGTYIQDKVICVLFTVYGDSIGWRSSWGCEKGGIGDRKGKRKRRTWVMSEQSEVSRIKMLRRMGAAEGDATVLYTLYHDPQKWGLARSERLELDRERRPVRMS